MFNASRSTGSLKRTRAIAGQRKGVGLAMLGAALAVSFAPAAKAALLISIQDLSDSTPAASETGSGTLTGGTFGPIGGPTDVTYSQVLASSNSPGDSGGGEVTLDYVKLTNNSAVPQTISITVGDTGYTAPGGPGSTLVFYGSFSGTADLGLPGHTTSGNVSMSSYADPSDDANAATSPQPPTTVTSTVVPTSFMSNPPPTSNSFSGFTPVALFQRADAMSPSAGVYSLAGVTTVTLAAGGVVDITNNTVTFASQSIPEPTSLGMIAAGGLLMMRRRRSRS